MDFKYVTKIPHLFPKNPKTEMPADILAFRNYLGHMIKASVATDELEFLSPIPCRKRVKRKPCEGFVKIMKQTIPEPYIYWHCSVCDDGGRIADWRGCVYDNSEFMKPHPANDIDIDPNPMVEVTISRDEMSAMLSKLHYDYDSQRIAYSARPSEKGIIMRGLYGDMDNFVGFLASDSNHEENKKRQKLLDSLYDKVEAATHEAYEECGLGAD